MKRFLIQTSVLNAEGCQTWYADADTEEEALRKYNEGGGDIYSSEVDVTSLGEPDLAGETTLDDFGDFDGPPQRPWAGLTNDEIDLLEELYAPPVHPDFVSDADHCFSLIKKVEAKLKEKNT